MYKVLSVIQLIISAFTLYVKSHKKLASICSDTCKLRIINCIVDNGNYALKMADTDDTPLTHTLY